MASERQFPNGFKVAAGVVFLGMRGIPLQKQSMEPIHSSQALVIGDIVSIGLGRRNSHAKVYPSMWAPIGGFIEEGETIKEGLIREVGEEVGLAMANDLRRWQDALIPLWVEIDWPNETVYYVYGYFYYFHLADEVEVQRVDNLAQIMPKHLHPTPINKMRKLAGGQVAAEFRGLGTIILDNEISAFGNFGIKETWSALHSPNVVGTMADILQHRNPSLVHASPQDVQAMVEVNAFTPITKKIIDGVANMNTKHRAIYTDNMNRLKQLLTDMAINYSLGRGFHGAERSNLPSKVHEFDKVEAAKHFQQVYTQRRNENAGVWEGLGFLRAGSERTQKSIHGRGMFDMAPNDSKYSVEEIVDWARKADFPTQWWTDKSLLREPHWVMQRGTQRKLPTPFLEYRHNRHAPDGARLIIPSEDMAAMNVMVIDELMSDGINQT